MTMDHPYRNIDDPVVAFERQGLPHWRSAGDDPNDETTPGDDDLDLDEDEDDDDFEDGDDDEEDDEETEEPGETEPE
jgi:hypothetical protein